MAEVRVNKPISRRIRHRGRASQIPIYVGKQLRFFIYQSDWKVLPMAAIIAALVSMVIRKDFFLTMEGNLKGAFALTCVAIWNGCFNSIQSVCRERPIIKREHRSGMHISSYVASHMIYQFALCLAQTGLSVYVMEMMGVAFPVPGFMTRWMILDVGISILLISYASDMMSLFISSVAHTTTGAMTVMPFVLIFQLVFSGGLLPLPDWTRPLADYTISNYGIKVIAAQSGYNEAPMVTAWNTLSKMRDNEVGGTVTLGQILDLLGDEKNYVFWLNAPAANVPSNFIDHCESIVKNPYVSVGSDTIMGDPADPYDWYEIRRRGGFAIFAQMYVGKGVPYEEVVRRNTSMVADHFGIYKRGRLVEGNYADIAVIDLPNYRYPEMDQMQYKTPQMNATGCDLVLCNGKVELKDGDLLRTYAGRVLRKNAQG